MKHAIFQYFLDYNGVGKCKHYRDSVGIPEWGQYSVDYFKKYAEMHNADHFFFDERYVDSSSNYFEITRVFKDPIFDEYDKVLYLDIDVMPKKMEANIFDINVKDIAGVPEWKHPEYVGTPKWSATQALTQRFNDFGSKLVQSTTIPGIRMINTGVVLWSKEARLKAREQFDDHEKWFHHKNTLLDTSLDSKIVGHSSHCLDQPYLNAMWTKYNFSVNELGIEWNRFPTKDENRPCNFAHYTGADSRYNIPNIFPETP